MPPYRANLGGVEGSGIYPSPGGAPDWASILHAVSGGASSLLQGSYLRKLAARNQAAQDATTARAVAKEDEDRAFKVRELDQKDQEFRLHQLEAGVTPGQRTVVPSVPAHDVSVAAPLPASMPGVATLDPSAPPVADVATPIQQVPARLRLPPLAGGTIQQPDTYDPTKAAGYLKTIDVAKLRADAQQEGATTARAAAMARVERTASLAAQRQLEHDQRVQKGKAALVARGLTANALETWRKSMADGVIQNHDGDLNAAEDFLANDALGRTYAVRGLSGEDLYAAAGRFRAAAGRAATGLLNNASPERAVEKVGAVRKIMRPGGMPASPDTAVVAPNTGSTTDTISEAEHQALLKLGWPEEKVRARYTIAAP